MSTTATTANWARLPLELQFHILNLFRTRLHLARLQRQQERAGIHTFLEYHLLFPQLCDSTLESDDNHDDDNDGYVLTARYLYALAIPFHTWEIVQEQTPIASSEWSFKHCFTTRGDAQPRNNTLTWVTAFNFYLHHTFGGTPRTASTWPTEIPSLPLPRCHPIDPLHPTEPLHHCSFCPQATYPIDLM